MRHVNLAKSFAQARAGKTDPQPDEKFKKLLELTKLYRQHEEAWFEKIRKNEFAVNEKDRMMEARRKLDQLISTIHL